MYKLLKRLRKHTEYLEISIENIGILVQNSESGISEGKLKEIEKCINKLTKIDLYILLEAIFLSSANFNYALLKDLEKKYSYMIMRWSNLYSEVCNSEDLNIHDEYFQAINYCNQIDFQLSNCINKINSFCVNYLNVSTDRHLNGYEYQIIAKAHELYHKEKNRRADLKINGVKALSKEDQFETIVMELNEEDFLDNLLGEEGFLDEDEFCEDEMETIMANEASILNDDFEVCFVSERKLLNDYILIDEETIFKVYKFLIVNNLLGDVQVDYFRYILTHKKLPNNSPQILWRGTMADARRMIDFFSLNDSIFNKCFVTESGKLIDRKVHKVKKNDTSEFSVILSKLAK